ncbi:MAG: hypothetical protein NTW95_05460 [Candidatus Aminicenantes bacterium]|nr:hypothetical protein [Candidatus Aminicenantes bacterium]
MNNHLWKSKILVAVVIGLFSLMVFTETVPSTKSLYSRLIAQGKEFYENGEFEKAVAKYQSAQAVAASNEEMAEASFLLAVTDYALVDMENCLDSLEKYFSVSIPSADPFLGKDFPPKFKEVFKAQKREYLQKIAGTATPSVRAKKKETQTQPTVREQETIAPQVEKKKKFPLLLLIATMLVAGAAIYYFAVVNNKEYTLTTSVGTGVNGAPASGAVKYKKGSTVSYNYSLASGYTTLVVTLDGAQVDASGTVTMDRDHSLSATAAAVENYVLTVAKNAGVNGTPETGAYTYSQGTTVNYSYTAATGYADLAVKLDNAAVAASGTFIMNANHSLTATAVLSPGEHYTLTVTTSAGVEGTPAAGVYIYTTITLVNYSYAAASGYANLVVKLNNIPVAASGLLIMKENLNLSITATHL